MGRDFGLSLCPGGWGIRPFKKVRWGLPGGGGGGGGLQLTDTSVFNDSQIRQFH